MRMAKKVLALAIAAMTLVLSFSGPAAADPFDEDSCYLASPRGLCSTESGGVEAHNSEHWIEVRADHPTHVIVVRDKDPGHNNAVVYRGNGTGSWVRINGVYGERYVVDQAANYGGPAGYVRIRNYT